MESSRSGKVFKNYIKVCFSVMRVSNLNIVLLNRFPDSLQWVLRISVQFDVLYT